MRRVLTPVAAYAAVLLTAAACKDHTLSECFDSGGTAYNIALANDTSLTFRWPSDHQPVKYWVEQKGTLPANVGSGLALWLGALRCGEISVITVTDSSTADVIITNPAQMPPAFVAALHADSLNACKGRTDPDVDDTLHTITLPIHTYIAPQGLDSAATEACYHFVVAHELGHTLGIFAHSPNSEDLMNFIPKQRALTVNDRFTIQTLYHLSHVGISIAP